MPSTFYLEKMANRLHNTDKKQSEVSLLKRNAMERLIAWKENPHRLPLILKGARQVGKTWLMKTFGAEHFPQTAYINFDRNERMRKLFSGDFSIPRILRGLSVECGMDIIPEETLILFDEIQEVPQAIQALKYFAEDTAHSYYILAAGSLLGIALHSGISFPVGKVETLNLYPLTFTEFLEAMGESELLRLLQSQDWELIAAFREPFAEWLKTYYFVGGMPAAAASYQQAHSFDAVRRIQHQLLNDYEQDFSKHIPLPLTPRVRMVWNGIPAQLAKENKKFIYSVLKKGARAREFETAIQWLADCGLCWRVSRVAKGGFPLKAYEDWGAFKLFLCDVGLLTAMVDLDEKTLLEGNAVFTEFKGALTEQYVCQQLISELHCTPYYWSAESSTGEIDFLIQQDNAVIPIEVKAAENLRAKSLKTFTENNRLPFGVRISLSNYRQQNALLNLPLYAISALPAAVRRRNENP